MTIPKWHALVLHVQVQERVPFQFKTIGEARRAQLHFNKTRRFHIQNALVESHLYPRDVIALYQSITSEIDRSTNTLYLCNMTPADRCFLEYLEKAGPPPEPPSPLLPFMDLTPNGHAEPKPEPEPPPKDEKKIWDPT